MSDVKPILFSGPMIRALLDGRKTQTRRALRADHVYDDISGEAVDEFQLRGWKIFSRDGPIYAAKVPYMPGQLLWVREAIYLTDDGHEEYAVFAADRKSVEEHLARIDALPAYFPDELRAEHKRLRPSIHMPRWASRLTLEVTSVKVERLQDMEGQHPSDSDAIAEGVRSIHHGDGAYYYSAFRDEPHPKNWCDPTDAFSELWDSLNAKRGYGWDTNPWVCATSFIVHQMNVDDFLAQRKAA